MSTCRGCDAPLEFLFCDLGVTPFANSYIPAGRAGDMEPFFPLKAMVCDRCLLVQLEHIASPDEIFSDYAYLSSASTSWVEHAREYCERAIARDGLDGSSFVVELASNDGYLLQWFVAKGIPVLGIEPATNVAAIARGRGVPTSNEFFGTEVGKQLAGDRRADLIVANNVLAHVPDLHDFVGGIAALLAPTGRVTIEFPHLLRLVEEVQFDTIYHEHFSYFSLLALEPVLAAHGLAAIDVEELSTHGGSLRLHLAHAIRGEGGGGAGTVERMRAAERAAGLDRVETYTGFGSLVSARKRAILRLLIDLADGGKRVAAYGAPAKGNTLLNYCGIGPELIEFTVDGNEVKQGTLLPGSRIPVREPAALFAARPDVVVLLPWNLRVELTEVLADVAEWGGSLAVLHPDPMLLS